MTNSMSQMEDELEMLSPTPRIVDPRERAVQTKIRQLNEEKLQIYLANMGEVDTIAYEIWMDEYRSGSGINFFEPPDDYCASSVNKCKKFARVIIDSLKSNGYYIRKEVTVL